MIEEENTIQKQSGLGIAGVILSIISVVFAAIPVLSYLSFTLGTLALIFSIISLAKKSNKGKAITGLVLAILSLVFAYGCNSELLTTVEDIGSSLISSSLNEITENLTDKNKFTLVSDKMVSDTFTSYIEGKIKNNTNKTYSYVQVTFNLYDASGAQIGTAMDNINNLEPNGTWKYKAIAFTTEKVAKYKFVEITGW